MSDRPRRPFASQSFKPEEVEWMDQLLMAVARGADTRVLARSPHLGKWLKKLETMKKRIEKMRRESSDG